MRKRREPLRRCRYLKRPSKMLTPEEEADATVVRAITLLAEAKGDPWVKKAPIFNMVKRLDPTFDPKEFKFATFAGMLKSLEGRLLGIRKGEFDQQVRVLTPGASEA